MIFVTSKGMRWEFGRNIPYDKYTLGDIMYASCSIGLIIDSTILLLATLPYGRSHRYKNQAEGTSLAGTMQQSAL